MKIPKPLLAKVAIASGVSAVWITGIAIYQGEQIALHPRIVNGAYQEPNALEKVGLWLGYKFNLIRRPPCGMCGSG